jgi:adenylylsulfate kinase-like enzyme
VSAPYEEPKDPEIQVASDALTPMEAAREIMNYVWSRWLNQQNGAEFAEEI